MGSFPGALVFAHSKLRLHDVIVTRSPEPPGAITGEICPFAYLRDLQHFPPWKLLILGD